MINPVSKNYIYSYTNTDYNKKPQQQSKANKVFDLNNLPSYKYQISFGKNKEEEIKKYLKRRKKRLTAQNISYKDINQYDINKLEGIQKGIEVFNGLSMEQIKFLAQHSTEFVLQRGCHNMCAHCYANAMPPSHQRSQDKINKIDFEDFEKLYCGFKELNKRLGFNIFKSSKNEYNTLFHDADSSMIFLRDNNGKTYDYLTLAKMINEITQKSVLFDTAGWNIKDKKTQERMEELVQKAISSNDYDFVEFNLSANPFQSLNHRALQHLKSGNYEKYEKFRDLYTTRMAKVLFTLTPLIEKEKLNIISRTLPNETKDAKGYREDDLLELYNEIFTKLRKLYKQDYETGIRKVIKNEEQIQKNLDYLNKKTEDVATNMGINGRLKNLVTDKKIQAYKKTLARTYKDPKKAAKTFYEGIIDINGKLYITNWYENYLTDIQLNYKNKDKKTAEISPALNKQIVTTDMIKD